MKLAFFCPVLNHHQAPVADELYQCLGDDFKFVELTDSHDAKGGNEDFSNRPYLVRVSESSQNIVYSIAQDTNVCVFAGYEALPYQIERLKTGKLTFDMGERWLKRGLLNLLSPRILAMVAAYHLRGWRGKAVYKLCCSAFAAKDCLRLGAYKEKCFKWGYFIENSKSAVIGKSFRNQDVRIMWCARLLKWKHPELVIELARNLKSNGYRFHIDIFGDEDPSMPKNMIYAKSKLAKLIADYELGEVVALRGNHPNDEIIKAMEQSDIFLFTSDKNEGWGAVANESMSAGCVLVASDAIGSSPYLISDGETGLMFRDGDVDSLTEKIEWLINHREEMLRIGHAAAKSMNEIWSPKNAAESLLILINNIEKGQENTISYGPCSNA